MSYADKIFVDMQEYFDNGTDTKGRKRLDLSGTTILHTLLRSLV